MVQELQASDDEVIKALVFGLIFLVFISLGIILFFHFTRRKMIQKEREKSKLQIEHYLILTHFCNDL